MTKIGIVHGSKEQAQPIIIGKNKIYVHENITLIDAAAGIYSYEETQYTKDEYIQLLVVELNTTREQITDLQLAMVDLYENGGANNG